MRKIPLLCALALLLTVDTFSQNANESQTQDSRRDAEPCTVEGLVVSAATGEPLKAARIILIERSEGEHPEGLTDSRGRFFITGPNVAGDREKLDQTTDAQGRFEIKKVVPGSYTISADVRPDAPEDTRYWTEQQIEVAGDNVPGLQLQLSADLELSGKVRAAGEQKVDFSSLLALHDETESVEGIGLAYPNKDGTFTVTHLRRTTYRLHYWMRDGWYVRSATFSSQNVLEDGLKLADGDAAHSLEITISPAVAQIDGVVLRGDDPVPGAMVKLLPDPDNPFRNIWPQTAWTDPHGHFAIKNIAPASYRAMAFDVEADPGNDDDVPLGVSITLAEKESKTVKLQLSKTPE